MPLSAKQEKSVDEMVLPTSTIAYITGSVDKIKLNSELAKALVLAKEDRREGYARRDKARTEFRIAQSKDKATVAMVFGIGRQFPISLHKGEWIKLLANSEAISKFVQTLPDNK